MSEFIITCPQCRKGISSKYNKCPHCKYKLSSASINLPDGPWVMLILMALGFYAMWYVIKYLGILKN